MSPRAQTVVTFKSTAFNMTERKPYFINDCCYGDDVALWMIGELAKQGVITSVEPGQEDFGWYLTFEIATRRFTFCVSFRADDINAGATWIGFIERSCSPLEALFRMHKRGITVAAQILIDQVLRSSPQIHEIRWFDDADSSF
jgi:hypothetical protein